MLDIQNRKDIEFLVNTFYTQVREDEVIGYIFNDVAGLDWDKHLPKMYDFWETVLLENIKYSGNPMRKHLDLNQKEALKTAHFERWISLWTHTINSHFQGENADKAIQRASLMAELIQHKIRRSGDPLFIQ